MRHTKLKYLLFLAGISIFASCVPDLNFTEPQPPETKDQTKFKKRYRGDYQSVDDNSIVTVSKTDIVQVWHIDTKVHKDSLELEFSDEGRGEPLDIPGYKLTLDGDSVHIVGNTTKQLFSISENQVLRYYKGYYFLNTKEDDDFWTVKMLGLEKDLLSFKRFLGTDKEIQELAELTTIDTLKNAEGEIIDYSIHPTLKEFKEILKSAHFNDGGSFKKIK